MNPQKCNTTHAEWLVERWHAEKSTTFGFDAFWRDLAKYLTVPDLRKAARILKIKRPSASRATLREQFAAAWAREAGPAGAL